MRKRPAFTLIELLVVMAIIAVLAAILFPVFSRAKEKAKQTACISNQRQMATGLMLYMSDYDDGLPMSSNYGVATTDPYRLWTNQIAAYLNTKGVFVCPSSEGSYSDSWANRGQQTIGLSDITSYDPAGCVEGTVGPGPCEGFTTSANANRFTDTARTALLCDTPGGPVAGKYRGYTFASYNGIYNANFPELSTPLCSDRDLVVELNSLAPAQLKPIFARHLKNGKDQGFCTIVFADGHAKAYNAKSILAMENGANIIWRFR